MALQYDSTEEFNKDLKKLLKRFRTLNDDLNVAKRNAIELYHVHALDNNSVEKIPGYCTAQMELYKIRKFACRALKGRGVNSGIRIIYAYFPGTKHVKFVEIYFKPDAVNMNYERAKAFLKSV